MADPESRRPETQGQPSREPGRVEGARSPEDRSFQGGRDLAQSGRRAADRGAEMWRQSMHPLALMQSEMSRWFDDLWRQGWTGGATTPAGFRGAGGLGFPTADLRETDRAYMLAVELPGLKPEDVEVSVDGDMLTVRGAKSEERDEGEGAWHVSERRFGRFERMFQLPRDVDAGDIQASCRHGVLRVTLPKRGGAPESRRRIEVKGEGR
ncbi:Hsp20/alpha crystallin family protein [Caulobacter sp. 17J80-11]|uniref:Hsp20/alpha crystallin family protein n=1 Tax=Caulobacter sp. 17J80-11 TaxID=2763502 RepID=UPI0016537E80|nr:Hsp20/alpha crystallin family protein [Caulobacter sp. 17J80-11]MBC6982306.1 Hsp20/alpha crystallin family protein [Caulobacter sp. 17J80-11]